MNQCDGCRAGWPLERGHHRDPSGNHWNDIGCTADRYPLDPLLTRMYMGLVASCGCLTKTNDPTYHESLCRFRLLSEAAERISALTAAASDLRAAQRQYMADRGNEALGRAVGVAAEDLDRVLGQTSCWYCDAPEEP